MSTFWQVEKAVSHIWMLPTIWSAASMSTRRKPRQDSRPAISRLVWFEIYDDACTAISRKKDIKKWRRAWKIALIEATNPEWDDLYDSITA